MDSQRVLQELRRLREQIKRHDERYFALGEPNISDREYDRLLQRLSGLERQHPELVRPDSPTQRAGAPSQEGFERVTHRSPMLALETLFGEEDVRGFDSRVRRLLGSPSALTYVVEPKMEGAAVELLYESGALAVASTRGDGYVGEDVTLNVKTILNVPLNLATPEGAPSPPAAVAVWADVYVETGALENLNHQWATQGRPLFPNPRSAAVRCLTSSDSRIPARCPLDIFCHGAGRLEGAPFRTQHELMLGLQQWGLRVNRPQIQVCETVDEMIAACRRLEHHRRRFPFEVSGAVIKINDLGLQAGLGETPRSLQWAAVYKFSEASPRRA